jgi:hypothetical protein
MLSSVIHLRDVSIVLINDCVIEVCLVRHAVLFLVHLVSRALFLPKVQSRSLVGVVILPVLLHTGIPQHLLVILWMMVMFAMLIVVSTVTPRRRLTL